MKKTIAAVLTALAMVVALVLPMTAFADDKTPQNVKPYEEKFEATGTEKDYDVVVEDFEEEDVTVEEAADEDVSLIVDEDTDAVQLKPSVKVKGLDIDLPNGDYAIDYDLSGNGTMKLVEPAKLTVKDGKAFARLAWNDPEVDKLILNGVEYLPVDFTKSHNIQGMETPDRSFGEPALLLFKNKKLPSRPGKEFLYFLISRGSAGSS